MSNNTETKVLSNSNEWINWIDEAITKNYYKYYEYDHFHNIQEIGYGRFGKVYRTNWKNSCKVLKSFFNFNNSTAKEIVNEVIILYILKNVSAFMIYCTNLELNYMI
jgi:predicted Ser/Thr protein kinase